MLKRLYLFIIILIVASCREDVIEVIDTPLPGDTDPDEVFEINLVGFTRDADREGVADVSLTILGSQQSTSGSSDFYTEKVLVGKKGVVIKAEKDGFLPSYKRVYHHRAIEDVIVNVELLPSPELESISSQSATIVNADGTQLNIEAGDFSSNGQLIFYSSNGVSERMIDMDHLYIENTVSYVNTEEVFFLDADVAITEGSTLELEVDRTQMSASISDLSLFKYDEVELTWTAMDQEFVESGGQLKFLIADYGWYAIGESVATVYGTLSVGQLSDDPVSNSEVVFSKVGDISNQNNHLYTNSNGEVIKYFPTELAQEVSLDGGVVVIPIDQSFSQDTKSIAVVASEDILKKVDAKVYDCELIPTDGFVGIISDNQHVIKRIVNGTFVGEALLTDDEVKFNIYNEDFTLLNTRQVISQNISTAPINFVTCSDQLRVEDGTSLLQNFSNCDVRLKPIESFIVGGVDESSIFLLSFTGEDVGEREGLLYSNIDGFESDSVNSEVNVNIKIYDEVTNIVAGFANGTFVNGESLQMTFIGEIE